MKKKKISKKTEKVIEKYVSDQTMDFIDLIYALRMVKPKKQKKFKGNKYLAKCCGSILQSKYSGEWVGCLCGDSYVDQTEYYVRCGGHIELIKDKKSIDKK